MALPSQTATALLANLPVVVGLYAFMAGSILYTLLSKNGHLAVGADSTIAPVLATGVASVAVVGTPGYGTAMAFTALLVGGLLVAAGLFRLGWMAEFFSTPVTTGILAGIAVEIAVRQVPIILGVPARGATTIDRVRSVIAQRSDINWWSVAIAAEVLAVILAAASINHRLPGALVALVLSVAAEIVREGNDEVVIVAYGPGGFVGELNLLTGQRPYLSARVSRAGRVLSVPPEQFRQLLDTKPDLSDTIFRAFVARREILRSGGAQGAIRLIGSQFSAEALARRALAMNGRPSFVVQQVRL